MIKREPTEISEKPEPCQMNYAPLKAELERYICKGKKCTMDSRLYNAFRTSVEKTRKQNDVITIILKIFGIVILLNIIVPIIGVIVLAIQMLHNPDNSAPIMLLIPLAVSVGATAAGIILIKLSTKIKERNAVYVDALNNIKPWLTDCYMFGRRQLLKYTYVNGDSLEHNYYIDLNDFYVELTQMNDSWWNTENAYAVILNTNGRKEFILFNDALK